MVLPCDWGSALDVGIIGGTGPLGSALAARLAASGLSVVVGSRVREKADEVAERLRAQWSGLETLRGGENDEAIRSETVVVAVPWESVVKTVEPFTRLLAGKVVLSLANALMKMGSEFSAIEVPRGSIAQLLQSTLPESQVVAALHHVPARELANLSHPIEVDTLVCSDFPEAKERAISLLGRVPGLRALDAGSLAQAGAIEAMTAVILNVNQRYHARSSIRLTGLEGEG